MNCPKCKTEMDDLGTRFVCPECEYDSCFGHETMPKADSDGNCAACRYFSDEYLACAAPDDVECDTKPERRYGEAP